MLTGLAVLALAAPKTIPLTCDNLGKTVPLTLKAGQNATAQFDGKSVIVTWKGKRTALPTQSCEEALSAPRVALLDANFDGWADLSVFDNDYGYAGVNVMHRLYFAQPSGATFRESSVGLVDVSNLTLNPATKTVAYTTKDGPFSLEITLCQTADGKDLFTCRKDEGEGGSWVKWYDQAGRVVGQRAKTGVNDTQFGVLRKTNFVPRPGVKQAGLTWLRGTGLMSCKFTASGSTQALQVLGTGSQLAGYYGMTLRSDASAFFTPHISYLADVAAPANALA
ncbi:hypothetical protein ACFP81_02070 [Deinococcus lacus]|uniref:VCBS repeat-containing protein n=1 Tax=Deinococcus lacus TaxID=392561 RepID=A0ABW1Y9S0_9DEIO